MLSLKGLADLYDLERCLLHSSEKVRFLTILLLVADGIW